MPAESALHSTSIMEKEQYLETKRKNFNLYFSVGKKGDATKGAGRVSGEMAEGAAVGETPSTADLIWTLLSSSFCVFGVS